MRGESSVDSCSSHCSLSSNDLFQHGIHRYPAIGWRGNSFVSFFIFGIQRPKRWQSMLQLPSVRAASLPGGEMVRFFWARTAKPEVPVGKDSGRHLHRFVAPCLQSFTHPAKYCICLGGIVLVAPFLSHSILLLVSRRCLSSDGGFPPTVD